MNCEFHFLYFTYYENLLDINLHNHNSYEIVYYVRGAGKTTINGYTYKYYAGTFSVTLPNNYHNESHEEYTEVIYINFDCSNLPFELLNGVYSDSPSKVIYNLMKKMKQEMIAKEIYYEYKLELLIQELLLEFNRIIEKKNARTEWLDYVVTFIDENYNNEINMKTLADLSGYSYHRFRHLFKEKIGLSPVGYILKRKIENSKDKLANSNFSITEVASICGFSNSCQFTTLFKKFTGVTPREYRKNNKIYDRSL